MKTHRTFRACALLLGIWTSTACLNTRYSHESPTQYLLTNNGTLQSVHLIQIWNDHGLPAPSGGGIFLADQIPTTRADSDRLFTTHGTATVLTRTRTLFNDDSSLSTHLKVFLNDRANHDKTFWLLSDTPTLRLALTTQVPTPIDYEKYQLESAALIDTSELRLIRSSDPQQLTIEATDIIELSLDAPKYKVRIIRTTHLATPRTLASLLNTQPAPTP